MQIYTMEQRKRVAELLRQGVPNNQIFELTGVKHSSITKIGRRLGLYATREPDPQKEEAMRLIRIGLSLREVSARLNRATSTIYGWCISVGLTPTGDNKLTLAYTMCARLTDAQFADLVTVETARRTRLK